MQACHQIFLLLGQHIPALEIRANSVPLTNKQLQRRFTRQSGRASEDVLNRIIQLVTLAAR